MQCNNCEGTGRGVLGGACKACRGTGQVQGAGAVLQNVLMLIALIVFVVLIIQAVHS